jgi:hypothetical protein
MPKAHRTTILDCLHMKTDRAKIHLDTFNTIASIYLANANTVTTEDDLENSLCIRKTVYNPIPAQLGMEYGEFLYCLRSGLDQMAWRLATPAARESNPTRVCFPIVEELVTGEDRRNFRKTLELFPENVRDVIDSFQPYKGPNPAQTYPLWQLNKLGNLDKHCVIPIHSRGKGVWKPHVGIINLLYDEDAIEVIVPLANKGNFNFDPNAPPKIELGDWDSDFNIPIDRLTDIYQCVTDEVAPAFARFDCPIAAEIPIRVGDPRPIKLR